MPKNQTIYRQTLLKHPPKNSLHLQNLSEAIFSPAIKPGFIHFCFLFNSPFAEIEGLWFLEKTNRMKMRYRNKKVFKDNLLHIAMVLVSFPSASVISGWQPGKHFTWKVSQRTQSLCKLTNSHCKLSKSSDVTHLHEILFKNYLDK